MAETLPPIPLVYNASTSESIVLAYAVRYGIDGQDFLNTLKCESHLNSDAVGDHGTSLGVAQIHLPAHKDISKEEALDPFWAVNWSAIQFKEGNQRMWSCWRQLHGSETS